jgi:hypothetical protein
VGFFFFDRKRRFGKSVVLSEDQLWGLYCGVSFDFSQYRGKD